MTDRDVVERVATEFGTAVMAIDKGKYRTEFAATLKGRRAVELMADIKPLMGERRQRAIDSALGCYRPPARKLDFKTAEETPSWMSPQELHWLAGWLEGEGSFMPRLHRNHAAPGSQPKQGIRMSLLRLRDYCKSSQSSKNPADPIALRYGESYSKDIEQQH